MFLQVTLCKYIQLSELSDAVDYVSAYLDIISSTLGRVDRKFAESFGLDKYELIYLNVQKRAAGRICVTNPNHLVE